MTVKSITWVTGLFMSRADAERAVEAILNAGYHREDVSVMMSDTTRNAHFGQPAAQNRTDNIAGGAGVGGMVGGSVGAVLAGIAATGTAIVFPGIGLVVAGPIAAAIAGAGAGGAAGGLLGAILGAGIPENYAKLYEKGLLKGGMVVGVKSTSKEQEHQLEEWFEKAGAEKIRNR